MNQYSIAVIENEIQIRNLSDKEKYYCIKKTELVNWFDEKRLEIQELLKELFQYTRIESNPRFLRERNFIFDINLLRKTNK